VNKNVLTILKKETKRFALGAKETANMGGILLHPIQSRFRLVGDHYLSHKAMDLLSDSTCYPIR
jgi:hypothetical protein